METTGLQFGKYLNLKAKLIPVKKKDYGYVQKVDYHHPEMHDEEILEVDSPFVSLFASGTEV
jgi:hypothetical protein